MTTHSYTAIVEREGDLFVSLCPELDVASQGKSIEEATANLMEVRRRGSHVVMQRHAELGTITVPAPDHAELKIGTLFSIIRQQSGVPRSEFES